MNQSAEMNNSLGKFFFTVGAVIMAITIGGFLGWLFFGYEDMTYVENVHNCSVTTQVKTRYVRRHRRTRRVRTYYVTVEQPDEGIDITLRGVSADYYKPFKSYEGRDDVTISFFKDEAGNLFPAYHINCTEKEAAKEYRQAQNNKLPRTLLGLGCLIGTSIISAGLNALRVAKRYANAPPVGQVSPQVRTLVSEFDQEVSRRDDRAAGSESQGKEEKPLTAEEKAELLREFDQLTADGKYKDKMR